MATFPQPQPSEPIRLLHPENRLYWPQLDGLRTLAFLLVSAGRSSEALTAARRAVSLEPGYWGHYFRLAHAAWGDERLRALERVLELYPDFPFAHFEAAMVHIARGAIETATATIATTPAPIQVSPPVRLL